MASSLSTITFMRRKRCVCAEAPACVFLNSLSLFHLLPYQYLHSFINEVTILVPVLSSDLKHTFAIYTPERTKQRWPIRLATATELEMHDWVCKGGSVPIFERKTSSMLVIIFHFSSCDPQAGIVKCVLL